MVHKSHFWREAERLDPNWKVSVTLMKKEEFMKNTTIPAYMSSPPKEMDRSPYRIASLASTMPPRKEDVLPPPKDPTPGEIAS